MARRGKSQARRSSHGSLPGWAWLLIGALLALVLVLAAPQYFKPGHSADGFFRPRPNPDARPSISALDEADPPRPRPAPQRPLPAPATEPDYDFYTVLPGQETDSRADERNARARAGAQVAREREQAARARSEAARQPEPPPRKARAEATRERSETAARPPATPPPVTAKPVEAKPAVHPDAAAPSAPPARAAAASTKSTSRYLLQAGTFSTAAEAEALKAQIALLGLQARIETGTADGKPVHRVRLGPYPNDSELSEVKQRLDTGGLPALAIRIE